MLDIEAMVDRMVPWLPTSAMASFLNMGKKGRLNSVSKTEFSRFLEPLSYALTVGLSMCR